MKFTCITLSGEFSNTRCNIILTERRRKKNCCREWIHAVDWTGTSLSACLLLLSVQALRSHSDGLSGIREYSWASLKSALLFLEGIHQNSVNFDNPPLSSPHCQPQSVMGGVEREERRGELYLDRLKSKKIIWKSRKVLLLISGPIVLMLWFLFPPHFSF